MHNDTVSVPHRSARGNRLLHTRAPRLSTSPANTATIEASLLALADSIFAAPRSLDADGFVSHFSGRADLVYLINTRQLGPRDCVPAAFTRLLSEHQRFEPTRGTRRIQILSDRVGVLTGEFETVAQEHAGEQWEAPASLRSSPFGSLPAGVL